MNRLNTGDTGQAVTSSNDGLLYSGFIGDGMYVLSSGSEFEVEVQSNNLLRMADGSALMQGRHIEIPASDSEYITINNGSQGMNRKDLVVFRYTKDVTGVESVNVVVIEGEETSGTAQAPDYIEGDILTGATLADMPLYVVELQGINITSVTPQFETIGSHKNALDKIAEHTTAIANLNSNFNVLNLTVVLANSNQITVTGSNVYGIRLNNNKIICFFSIGFSTSAQRSAGLAVFKLQLNGKDITINAPYFVPCTVNNETQMLWSFNTDGYFESPATWNAGAGLRVSGVCMGTIQE